MLGLNGLVVCEAKGVARSGFDDLIVRSSAVRRLHAIPSVNQEIGERKQEKRGAREVRQGLHRRPMSTAAAALEVAPPQTSLLPLPPVSASSLSPAPAVRSSRLGTESESGRRHHFELSRGRTTVVERLRRRTSSTCACMAGWCRCWPLRRADDLDGVVVERWRLFARRRRGADAGRRARRKHSLFPRRPRK